MARDAVLRVASLLQRVVRSQITPSLGCYFIFSCRCSNV
jgi:hypothetical protein